MTELSAARLAEIGYMVPDRKYDSFLSKEQLDYVNAIRGLLAELRRREWQPIETAPKDSPIQRWHRVWKCPITVKRNPGFDGALEWVTGCNSNSWPEEAFTPHWQPLPEPPDA